MSTMDACRILTIKHSLTLITNMAQKQNEHHECMWNSENQALTYYDHKHGTEEEWVPWMHAEFWQSSTHSLWSQTWHRSRMSTMNACGILTIKHSLCYGIWYIYRCCSLTTLYFTFVQQFLLHDTKLRYSIYSSAPLMTLREPVFLLFIPVWVTKQTVGK